MRFLICCLFSFILFSCIKKERKPIEVGSNASVTCENIRLLRSDSCSGRVLEHYLTTTNIFFFKDVKKLTKIEYDRGSGDTSVIHTYNISVDGTVKDYTRIDRKYPYRNKTENYVYDENGHLMDYYLNDTLYYKYYWKNDTLRARNVGHLNPCNNLIDKDRCLKYQLDTMSFYYNVDGTYSASEEVLGKSNYKNGLINPEYYLKSIELTFFSDSGYPFYIEIPKYLTDPGYSFTLNERGKLELQNKAEGELIYYSYEYY